MLSPIPPSVFDGYAFAVIQCDLLESLVDLAALAAAAYQDRAADSALAEGAVPIRRLGSPSASPVRLAREASVRSAPTTRSRRKTAERPDDASN